VSDAYDAIGRCDAVAIITELERSFGRLTSSVRIQLLTQPVMVIYEYLSPGSDAEAVLPMCPSDGAAVSANSLGND